MFGIEPKPMAYLISVFCAVFLVLFPSHANTHTHTCWLWAQEPHESPFVLFVVGTKLCFLCRCVSFGSQFTSGCVSFVPTHELTRCDFVVSVSPLSSTFNSGVLLDFSLDCGSISVGYWVCVCVCGVVSCVRWYSECLLYDARWRRFSINPWVHESDDAIGFYSMNVDALFVSGRLKWLWIEKSADE